jgi:hypothetical protein
MVVKSIEFAAIVYGMGIALSVFVAGIIKLIYFVLRRRQSLKSPTDLGKEA